MKHGINICIYVIKITSILVPDRQESIMVSGITAYGQAINLLGKLCSLSKIYTSKNMLNYFRRY